MGFAWSPRQVTLLMLALGLAVSAAGCGSALAAPDEPQAKGATIADLAREGVEAAPPRSVTEASAPVEASPSVELASYALAEGYEWKDGWWWLDHGDGVLHAMFEELSHYGVGVMLPVGIGDARKAQAFNQMAEAVFDLELDQALASDAMAFFETERNAYAGISDPEYSSSTTLNGRQVETAFWRSQTEQGPTAGFLIVFQKP